MKLYLVILILFISVILAPYLYTLAKLQKRKGKRDNFKIIFTLKSGVLSLLSGALL